MDKIDARAQAPDEPRRPSENTLSAADKLIQEQRRAIAYLTGRVKTLEARITELEKENAELKKKLPAGKPNS